MQSRTISKEAIFGILICFCYSLFYIFVVALNGYSGYRFFSIFVYVQFFYTIFSWHRITHIWIDAYILFIVALYVFTLGHAFLDLFNAVEDRFSLIESWSVSDAQYIECEFYALLFILAFHLGAIYSYRRNIVREKDEFSVFSVKTLKYVSMLFLVASFPFYVYRLYYDSIAVAVAGYIGLYDSDYVQFGGVAAIIRILSDYYVPSIIGVVVYCETVRKKVALAYIVALLTVCIPTFFLGSRTNAVIVCGILFLLYSRFHQIKRRQILMFAIIGYMVMSSLVIVRNFRQLRNVATIHEITTLTSESESNPVSSMLSEMGWSMFPLIKTVEYKSMPQEHFLYGESFLWSFSTVIPNFFWDVHPGRKHADMSAWITEKTGLNFGVGFSLVAEAYANFGVLGGLFMFVLSVMFMKLFIFVDLDVRVNPLKLTLSLIFLWFIIRIVRNSFLDTFRYLVYYVCVFYLMFKIFYRRADTILYKLGK